MSAYAVWPEMAPLTDAAYPPALDDRSVIRFVRHCEA